MEVDRAHSTHKPAYLVVLEKKSGRKAELPILVDGGPLFVAGIWNWSTGYTVPGLYLIYHKVSCSPFGPYFASIILAERGMRLALKEIPKDIWGHEPQWYDGQTWIGKWINENLGKPMDLIGGEWEKKPEEEAP